MGRSHLGPAPMALGDARASGGWFAGWGRQPGLRSAGGPTGILGHCGPQKALADYGQEGSDSLELSGRTTGGLHLEEVVV